MSIKHLPGASPPSPNDEPPPDAQDTKGSVPVECPNPACRANSRISAELIGRNARCRKCGSRFQVTVSTDRAPSPVKSTPDQADALAPPPPAAAPPPGIPSHIGRFLVRRKLGHGAFGTVYQAYDPHLEREVALKVPRSAALNTPERVERFLGDAKAAARLHHPHIVPVFEASRAGDAYFIASAFIEGKTLGQVLDDGRPDMRRAVQIVRALAEALAYAHEQGIVHRDVKPDNVMLDAGGQPHLIDFGLAQRNGPTDSASDDEADPNAALRKMKGAVRGTAAYMSPEQASGQSDDARPAFDQYSLGVTLYELLCGQTPFSGPLAIVLYNVVHTEPPSPRGLNAKIPPDLEAVCLRAMAKRPEDRYATCQHLADDLRRWLEGRPVLARRLSLRERLTRWCKRQPVLAAALGAVATLLLAIAVLGVWFGEYSWAKETIAEDDLKRIADEEIRLKQQKAETEEQRRLAVEDEAYLTVDGALAMGEKGEIGQAMVLMSEGLRLGTRAHAERFQYDVLRPYLAGYRLRLHRLRDAVEHPTTPFSAVVYRDDHSFFAAGGTPGAAGGGGVELLDEAGKPVLDKSGKPVLPLLKLKGVVRALAYDAKRRLLLTGGDDGCAKLWDVAAADDTPCAVLSPADANPPLPVHVTSVAISPDATAYLIGCDDGNAYLWRLNPHEEPDAKALRQRDWKTFQRLVHGPKQPVQAVAFSSDGRTILTGASGYPLGGEARVWDVAAPDKPLAVLPHANPVNAVAFAPTGGLFVTASGGLGQGDAQFWVMTGALVARLGDPLFHVAPVYTASFSPDGAYLVTAGQDRAAHVWDVTTRKEFGQPLHHAQAVRVAVFRPDSRVVLTDGDENAFRLWETAAPPHPRMTFRAPGFFNPVLGAAFNADGTRILIGGPDAAIGGGAAHLFENRDGKAAEVAKYKQEQPVRAVACDASGTRLLIGGGDEDKQSGEVCLWEDKVQERPIRSFPHRDVVRSLAFRGDASRFAAGCDDGCAYIWSVDKNDAWLWRLEHKSRFPGKNHVYSLAFSPDGHTLLTGASDRFACLWDADTGKLILELKEHPDAVLSVAFGADGHTLLVGYAGGARLWDWNQSREKPAVQDLGTFPHQAGIFGTALSADCRRVLTGGTDGTTRLWDAATKRPVCPPWRRNGVTFTVGFLPGGSSILEAGTDVDLNGDATIWDVPDRVDGDQETIDHWSRVVTGLTLKDGIIVPLSAKEWRDLQPPREADDSKMPRQETKIGEDWKEAPPPHRPAGRDPVPVIPLVRQALPPPPPPPPDPHDKGSNEGGTEAPTAEGLLPPLPPPPLKGELWDRLLCYAPPDTEAVAYLDAAHALPKPGGEKTVAALTGLLGVQEFVQASGVNPLKDVDGLLLAGTGLSPKPFGFLLIHGNFDFGKFAKAVERAKFHYSNFSKTSVIEIPLGSDRSLYAAFLDANTICLSSSEEVLRAAAKSRGTENRLSEELNAAVVKADKQNGAWLAAALTMATRTELVGNGKPSGGGLFLTKKDGQFLAMKLEDVTGSLRLATGLQATFRFHTSDREVAGQVKEILDRVKRSCSTQAPGDETGGSFLGVAAKHLTLTIVENDVKVELAIPEKEIEKLTSNK